MVEQEDLLRCSNSLGKSIIDAGTRQILEKQGTSLKARSNYEDGWLEGGHHARRNTSVRVRTDATDLQSVARGIRQ